MIHDIISRLNAEGFPIRDFTPDGRFQRFSIDDKDTRKSGFYVGYRNFQVNTGAEYYFVIYGSWRDGLENAKRFSTLTGGLTPAESKLQQEQIKKCQKEAEKFKNEAYAIAAEEALKKWNSLSETGVSPYIQRKKIGGVDLGVRFDNFNGVIYVPARDENGKLWSFETIKYDGSKLSHPGGRKQGCFHVIGGGDGRKIYFAEGLATAASIHIATGERVVCTFGASGLRRIATAFRKAYPDGEFVICGDKDKDGLDTSRVAAETAAKTVACPAIFPTFSSGRGKDFNDLHCTEGIEAVQKQLSTEIVPQVNCSATEGIFPDEDEKGKRLGSLKNVKELLRRRNITVRYNVISKSIEINNPEVTCSLDNREIVNHVYISDWCKRAKIPTEDLSSNLVAIADLSQYNPVISWISTEPWDGQSRLQDFFDTIQSHNKALKEILMRKWLISAVAALYEPSGVYAGGVLVLQGKQYSGKTKWFKNLVPHETGLNVLAEGVTLRPDDKDSVYQAISHWIVELGELDATFRKSDISQLKSFLTKENDEIRLPYAEKSNKFPRRTVFMASVNETKFLNDQTGNRRFWTIECERIDYDHCVNMQQLWAEVTQLYFAKESWKLTAEEDAMLNEHNEQFESVEPIEERIRDYYAWNAPNDQVMTVNINATAVCIAIGILNPNRSDVRNAAHAIQKISGQKPQGRRTYDMPLLRAKHVVT